MPFCCLKMNNGGQVYGKGVCGSVCVNVYMREYVCVFCVSVPECESMNVWVCMGMVCV
jgi:hypothetical protein